MRISNVIYFHRFEVASFEKLELLMRREDAELLSGGGYDQSDNAKTVIEQPYMVDQFRKLDVNDIRLSLKPYGAWNDIELADDDENQLRLVWLAGNDIMEAVEEKEAKDF